MDAALTAAVVLVVLTVMARGWAPPSAAMFGGMVVLLVAGVVDAGQALAGFSNPAPMTVAALFVVARAVERTGALKPLVDLLLGDGRSRTAATARLVVPTAATSAFLNNTPIVAMLLPEVTGWALERRQSPSWYLMPLSFAAILGGTLTVIGTSTNLVVSGLLEATGRRPVGFFEIGKVGLPVTLVGVALLVVLAPRILPARRTPGEEIDEEGRRFVSDMVVLPGGPVDGKTVETAGLRHLRAGFLVTVQSPGQPPRTARPETPLRAGDRLRFVGRADQVVDLQRIPGLASAEQSHLKALEEGTYFEVVIGEASPLAGRTLREVDFRRTYQAAVVAIHRAGQLLEAKLGEVPLRAGDTLIVLADSDFADRWRDRGDFLVIAPMGRRAMIRSPKAGWVILVLAGIVLASSSGVVPILHASLAGATLLVVIGALTPGEARAAVDLDVIVLIASAFGVAAALQSSGLASNVAQWISTVMSPLGARGALLGVVLATVVLTALVSNNAAALLMFPVAAAAAESTGLDVRGVAISLAVAASADFLTPIGYQTNTMVYGPGGYRFGDYARLGAPLTVATTVLLVWLVPLLWG
jgi:di/tricarboxylate transporter